MKFGSVEYQELARHLILEAHGAYGSRSFFWINQEPYVLEEEFDWFVAGRAFGCVKRSEFGAIGDWTDMQLGWLEDFYLVYEEYQVARPLLLDGGAIMTRERVVHTMNLLKRRI